MYTIPAPRTLDETLHLIIPEDSPHNGRLVFDAMRVISYFVNPDDGKQPAFPAGRSADGSLSVIGHRKIWHRDDATQTLLDIFGPDAPARVSHFVAAYRTAALDEVDDTFMFAIAIIVWGGADKGDWLTWDLHDRAGTDGNGLGYLCPAYWIARWGKESLNALVAAGYTYKELEDIYGSETLPDPSAIATLVGLRGTN